MMEKRGNEAKGGSGSGCCFSPACQDQITSEEFLVDSLLPARSLGEEGTKEDLQRGERNNPQAKDVTSMFSNH